MKTIMDTHEEYCRVLKLEVKRYTEEELYRGLYQTQNNPNYEDYHKIFQDEIDLRKNEFEPPV